MIFYKQYEFSENLTSILICREKKICKTNEKQRRYGQKYFNSKKSKNLNAVQNNLQFLLYFKNWLGVAAGQPEDLHLSPVVQEYFQNFWMILHQTDDIFLPTVAKFRKRRKYILFF